MAMPRLPGARFSRLQHWLAQAMTASVFCMASWNSSFMGPIVAHTMLPKAYMCSRPSLRQADQIGQHLVDEGLSDVVDRIDGLAFARGAGRR